MNPQPTSSKITLEKIALRKEEILRDIRKQKQQMTNTARDLLAPLAPVASGGNAIMRTFSTGMAIFDGVMLGLKIIRKFRKLIKR